MCFAKPQELFDEKKSKILVTFVCAFVLFMTAGYFIVQHRLEALPDCPEGFSQLAVNYDMTMYNLFNATPPNGCKELE